MTVKEFGQQNTDAVMLLHGGGLSWWNFRAVARLLERDYHVVMPVLDGHAGSDEPFTSIEDNAARLISYIDTHFGGQIAVLGGLSLGGQVALGMISQRPDICHYALIESVLVKPSKLTEALVGPTFGMSYGLIKQRWFARLQAVYLGIPNELFEDYYRDTCAITKADMIAFLKANCVYEIKPSLAETTAKVKIVAGAKEQKSILDSSKRIHTAISGSRLEILPGLRHGKTHGELLCLHEAELTGGSPGSSQRKDGPQRVLLCRHSESDWQGDWRNRGPSRKFTASWSGILRKRHLQSLLDAEFGISGQGLCLRSGSCVLRLSVLSEGCPPDLCLYRGL